MKVLQVRDQHAFAERSMNSLLEIVSLVETDKGVSKNFDLRLEAVRTVKAVFDQLAWRDGVLDSRETHMLDLLLDPYPDLLDRLRMLLERPHEPSDTPLLLDLTRQYDVRNGTFVSQVLVNTLEMIGFGVLVASGNVNEEDQSSFRTYISKIRAYVSA